MTTDITQPSQNYEEDAQVFQTLQGGAQEENPYMPFLQPRVMTVGNKKFLRIPKNQEMMTMAKFFEDNRSSRFNSLNDLASRYLTYRHDIATEGVANKTQALDEKKFGLDVAKYDEAVKSGDFNKQMQLLDYELKRIQTEYNVNKPYSGGGGDGTDPVGFSQWAAELGITNMSEEDAQQLMTDYNGDLQIGLDAIDQGYMNPSELASEMSKIYPAGVVKKAKADISAFAKQKQEEQGTGSVWYINKPDGGYGFYRGTTPITREQYLANFDESELKAREGIPGEKYSGNWITKIVDKFRK